MPGLKEVLKEIARTLQPERELIFSVPSQLFVKYLWFPLFFKRIGLKELSNLYVRLINKTFRIVHFYSPKAWKELLSEVRLELTDFKYYFPNEVMHFWDKCFFTKLLHALLSRLNLVSLERKFYHLLFSNRISKYFKIQEVKGAGLIIVAKKRETL